MSDFDTTPTAPDDQEQDTPAEADAPVEDTGTSQPDEATEPGATEGDTPDQAMPDTQARQETRDAVDASTPAPTDDDGNALIDPGTTPPTIGVGPGEGGQVIP